MGALTVWASLSIPAILVHVGAAEQSAKGLGDVEYKVEDVIINKYTIITGSQNTETTAAITVK